MTRIDRKYHNVIIDIGREGKTEDLLCKVSLWGKPTTHRKHILNWLVKERYIEKQDHKYVLTKYGWEYYEAEIKRMKDISFYCDECEKKIVDQKNDFIQEQIDGRWRVLCKKTLCNYCNLWLTEEEFYEHHARSVIHGDCEPFEQRYKEAQEEIQTLSLCYKKTELVAICKEGVYDKNNIYKGTIDGISRCNKKELATKIAYKKYRITSYELIQYAMGSN